MTMKNNPSPNPNPTIIAVRGDNLSEMSNFNTVASSIS